jgi:hypothetical protein
MTVNFPEDAVNESGTALDHFIPGRPGKMGIPNDPIFFIENRFEFAERMG